MLMMISFNDIKKEELVELKGFQYGPDGAAGAHKVHIQGSAGCYINEGVWA